MASQVTDTTGRVAIITGASGGIGRATAAALVKKGLTVVMAVRDTRKGEAVAAELRQETGAAAAVLHVLPLDLRSLTSVRGFVDAFHSLQLPLHVLINNAGVVCNTYRQSVDGLEEMFAVNHLGHFWLTLLLLGDLTRAAPSRIVHVSSAAHDLAPLPLAVDRLAEPCEITGLKSSFAIYGRSKLCNLLFSLELARRLEGSGVTSNAVHPGVVNTHLGVEDANRLLRWCIKPLRVFMRTPERGCESSVYCALSPEVAGVTGKYFVDCEARPPKPAAQDTATAQQLWAKSCEIVAAKTGEDLKWASDWRFAAAH